MKLMDRVAALLHPSVDELVDKSTDPEKMLGEIMLDVQNQLLQVKTQLATAIAGQHELEKKKAEREAEAASWRTKAAQAVASSNDEMAREALDRSLSHAELATVVARQLEDEQTIAAALRRSFLKLQQKLVETRNRRDLLAVKKKETAASLARYEGRIRKQQAAQNTTGATDALSGEPELDRCAMLVRDRQVERLLEELKTKKALKP